MPQAVPKSKEIGDFLIDVLVSETVLDDFTFRKYLNEIDKLNDDFSYDYLMALTYGAKGLKEDAVSFFERAIRHNFDIFALNYATYISQYGSNMELLNLVERLTPRFHVPPLLRISYDSYVLSGDISKAARVGNTYIEASDEKDGASMQSKLDIITNKTDRFKEMFGMSDTSYIDLASVVLKVADEHGVIAENVELEFIDETNSAIYLLNVKTNDTDILSDMNVDVAFSLAEHDSLVGKNFSVWYQGVEGVPYDRK